MPDGLGTPTPPAVHDHGRDTSRRMIAYVTEIDDGYETAEPALLHRTRDLDGLARIAYRETERMAAAAGLQFAPAEHVRLDVAPVVRGPGHTAVPFVWSASGPAVLFSQMSAELVLRKVGPRWSRLALRGSYDPEPGPGGRADRVRIRLTQGAARRLTDRVAARLTTGREVR